MKFSKFLIGNEAVHFVVWVLFTRKRELKEEGNEG